MKILVSIFMVSAALFAQNIEITALNFKADEKEGFTEFTGSVNVIKGNSELNATKVIVFFDENRVAKRYEAYDNVSFYIEEEESKFRGTSQKLFYYPQMQKYEFFVGVDIYDIVNRRTLQGDEVEVLLNEGKASVVGSEERPVKFIFEMDKN